MADDGGISGTMAVESGNFIAQQRLCIYILIVTKLRIPLLMSLLASTNNLKPIN
jgi:hypothetical protein